MTRSINSLALLLVVLTVATATLGRSELLLEASCGDVTKAVAPCLTFLKGSGDTPSQACCGGAKDLANQAKTKNDRQAICECLKSALSKVGSYDPSRVPLVTTKCGVAMTIPPITDKTDCSKA